MNLNRERCTKSINCLVPLSVQQVLLLRFRGGHLIADSLTQIVTADAKRHRGSFAIMDVGEPRSDANREGWNTLDFDFNI